jgi:hypothetical protein
LSHGQEVIYTVDGERVCAGLNRRAAHTVDCRDQFRDVRGFVIANLGKQGKQIGPESDGKTRERIGAA